MQIDRLRKLIHPFSGEGATHGLPFQKVVEKDVRILKAIITLSIYFLLFLLLKIMYDQVIRFPDTSNVFLIAVISLLLTLAVIFFNAFSRRILTRISFYTNALEHAKLYAESIVQSIQIPLLVVDAGGGICSANTAFLTLNDSQSKKILNQNLFLIDSGRWQIPEIEAFLAENDTSKGFLAGIEVERNIPLKGSLTLLISGHRLHDIDKCLYILSIQDITNQKKTELNLRHLAVQAEQANRAKSTFLSNITHELRTPLTAILGFSDILSEGMAGELNNQQSEYIQNIHRSGQHLLSLINDLLDLSKIEAGKMSLNLDPSDIQQLLQECLSILENEIKGKQLEMEFQCDPEIGWTYLDQRKIKQVIINLIGNAIKYTEPGGKIKVTAERVLADENQSPIMSTTANHFLQVQVQDTGIGIAENDLIRLFTPFEQLDIDLNRIHQGTGLGLNMVKRLVEMHGGRVWAESQLGIGSYFTFQIPIRRERREEERRCDPDRRRQSDHSLKPTPREAGSLPFKLLMIDPDQQQSEATRQQLNEKNLTISILSTIEEIDFQGQLFPEIILANTGHPDLTGWHILEKAVLKFALFETPVILYTEHGGADQGFILPIHRLLHPPVAEESWERIFSDLGFNSTCNGKTVIISKQLEQIDPVLFELQRKDPRFESISDPLQAINVLLKGNTSLIIIELVMPGISGIEIIHLVKSNPEISPIPVIALLPRQWDQKTMIALHDSFEHLIQPAGFSYSKLTEALNLMALSLSKT